MKKFYIQTALYFKIVKNTDWENVDPKEVMGYNYSAISNWVKNVQTEIAKIPNLIPQGKAEPVVECKALGVVDWTDLDRAQYLLYTVI